MPKIESVSIGHGWVAVRRSKGELGDHVQMNRTFKATGSDETTIQIIVGLKGWNYKKYETPDGKHSNYWGSSYATDGYNIRWSMNGPAWLTWNDFEDIRSAIKEARWLLEQPIDDGKAV